MQIHYDAFLAGIYSWIRGGADEQIRKNRAFFVSHDLMPGPDRIAVDLGTGCGFESIPLVRIGYSKTAADFCGLLLDTLRSRAGDLTIESVEGDILDFAAWSGRPPSLIVCMGDTLTHLPSPADAGRLARQCFTKPVSGGRLILTLRDYSREPDGAVVVIPFQRTSDRIFLCRLVYDPGTVTVQDIDIAVSGRRGSGLPYIRKSASIRTRLSGS